MHLAPEEFKTPDFSFATEKQFAHAFERNVNNKRAVLGIGTLSHDSAAAIVSCETGEVIFATAEERLSNIKHDSRFPFGAIVKCIMEATDRGYYIGSVGINFDPNLFLPNVLGELIEKNVHSKTDSAEIIERLCLLAREGNSLKLEEKNGCFRAVAEIVKTVAHQNLNTATNFLSALTWYYNVGAKYQKLAQIIRKAFQGVAVNFYPHHDCHAATALHGAGIDRVAILVIDGHGEFDTTSIYIGENNSVRKISATTWPVSLGAIYLAVTRYLGFDYGDEYKVMGMAAYGKPRFIEYLYETVGVSDNGTLIFTPNQYFSIEALHHSGQIRFTISDSFLKLCPRRSRDEQIQQAHFDLAASVQLLIEKMGVELANVAQKLTGCKALAIAGGVGLNGLMNDAIRKAGIFEDIFIYPAASDDGTSVGAAQLALGNLNPTAQGRMQTVYFGQSSEERDIECALEQLNIKFSRPESVHHAIARAIYEGKIVARYAGKAEFGPRALGNRSILANPRLPQMKEVLNTRIKHREEFRPFAPACLRERVADFFDIDSDAPFMIMIVKAKEFTKKIIPAVVHNDGTARVQTVDEHANPDFFKTLKEFEKISGVPVLINTSFNINGEAIVDTPLDAIESFLYMDIDFLAIGDYWVEKSQNISPISQLARADYLSLRKDRYKKTFQSEFLALDPRKYAAWFYVDKGLVKKVALNILHGN